MVEELYLPWVRFSVEDLSDKQHRVVFVELDEFHKRVIRHQVIGNFFRDRLCRVGGRGGGGRQGDICLGAAAAAPAAASKGGVTAATAATAATASQQPPVDNLCS